MADDGIVDIEPLVNLQYSNPDKNTNGKHVFTLPKGHISYHQDLGWDLLRVMAVIGIIVLFG